MSTRIRIWLIFPSVSLGKWVHLSPPHFFHHWRETQWASVCFCIRCSGKYSEGSKRRVWARKEVPRPRYPLRASDTRGRACAVAQRAGWEGAPLFRHMGSFQLFMQFNPIAKAHSPKNTPWPSASESWQKVIRKQMGVRAVLKGACLTVPETLGIKPSSLLS